VIKFVSDLQEVGGFLRVVRFPPPIQMAATINQNIVERGVQHHQTNKNKHNVELFCIEYTFPPSY